MNISVIFDTVIAMSLKGIIAILVIEVLVRLLRKRFSSRWTYLIWLIVIIRLLVPLPFESSWSLFNVVDFEGYVQLEVSEIQGDADRHQMPNLTYERSMENAENSEPNDVKLYSENEVDTSEGGTKDQSQTTEQNMIEMLEAVWVIGVLGVLLFIISSQIGVAYKLKKEEETRDVRLHSILMDCLVDVGINREVTLIVSSSFKSPVIFGLLKPKLVLNPAIINELDDDEVKHIFLHELVHLKNNDLIIKWLSLIMQCVHWFNPFVWWCSKRINESCELACDEGVLNVIEEEEHINYGNTIITAAKLLSDYKPLSSMVGMAEQKTNVFTRVKQVKNFKRSSKLMMWMGRIIVFILMMLLLTNQNVVSGLTEENVNDNEPTEAIDTEEKTEITEETIVSEDDITKKIPNYILDGVVQDMIYDQYMSMGSGYPIDLFHFDEIYDFIVSSKKTHDINSSLRRLENFMIEEKSFLHGEYIRRNISALLAAEFKSEYDREKFNDIGSYSLGEYMNKLHKNGFTVYFSRGAYHLTPDYDRFLELEDDLSEDSIAYYEAQQNTVNELTDLEYMYPRPELTNELIDTLWLELNIEKSLITPEVVMAMQGITLEYKNLFGNFEPISVLHNLRFVHGMDAGLTDISFMTEMPYIEEIYLSNNLITDVSPLSNKEYLLELFLDGNSIESVDALAGCKRLNWLGLADNNIKSIEALGQLENLTLLRLNNNKINDITPLGETYELRQLFINHNEVENISALSRHSYMQNLDVGFNKITDLEVLRNLPSLYYLSVQSNQIDNIYAVVYCKNLRELYVGGNPTNDYSAVDYLENLEVFETNIRESLNLGN